MVAAVDVAAAARHSGEGAQDDGQPGAAADGYDLRATSAGLPIPQSHAPIMRKRIAKGICSFSEGFGSDSREGGPLTGL